MTPSTHATVFDIYLLQEQICSHLTLRDIRRCSLVSRDFSNNFSPFLYRTISIYRKSTYNKFHTPESLAALAKYCDQVTHVDCVFARIWKTLLDAQCHNLVTLNSGCLPRRHSNRDQNRFQTGYITDLIEVNPRLYSVMLTQFLFEPEVVARFCSVLRNHAKLRELSIINPEAHVRYTVINLFIWSSFRLEKLCIDLCTAKYYVGENGRPQLQEYVDLTGSEEPVFALKELALSFRMHSHQSDAFFRLLTYAPHIERLATPTFDHDHQMNELFSTMETTMTNVQHLNVHSLGVQGALVARLVSLCRNLKTFVSSSLLQGVHLVADALLLHHRETLEELRMARAARMTSRQVLAFLIQCPKLRIVDMMVTVENRSLYYEVLTRQRIGDAIVSTADMDATVGSPWACTGLEVLKLRYAVPERGQDEQNQMEGEGSIEWVLPSVLYNRIAELTQLETLWLGKVEPQVESNDSFILAAQVGRGHPLPPALQPPPPPKSESEIQQHKIRTLNMSNALLAWRSLPRLRQLHLRGVKNFIDKGTVREARKSWKDLEWICYR
ncbi:hypothetical protein BGW39_007642 [Mortierella sp. 14UC]|nr:hypothetical protein BGW39_007642 [Mortierella sp. 14UC]